MDPFSLGDGCKIDLDAVEFDPTDAVNKLLGSDPDPEEVFELIGAIQTQIELNDDEILSVLRTQGQRASKSHKELITAKGSIGELHNTMGQILEEANQTQTKVDVICKDIRAMDHAKKNLTQSISILENFGTLTDALNDLKESSNDREKYAENASKLESVLCLMDKFEKYQDVPKVATFRDMVDLITRNLHQQILREFQLLWIVADPFAGHFSVADGASFEERSQISSEQEKRLREAQPKFQAMRDAALVAAALERRTKCKTAIIEDIMASWMTNLRATKLEIERDRSVELSVQLEGVFAWLRDILEGNKYFVEQWKVFPEDWQMTKEVALRFCSSVEPYITMVLQDWGVSSGGEDAESRSSVLLQAWGATRTFEKHLMALAEGVVAAGSQDSGYEAAKRRARNIASGQAAAQDTSKSVFDGRLRALFSPHLSIVVAWHTKTLSTAMNLLIEQDEANAWRPASVARGGGLPSGATRLDSARALILECRSQAEASLPVLCQSVDSVASFAEAICCTFKSYSDRLAQILPSVRMDPRRGVETADLPLERAPVVCTSITTAAYVKDNVPLLQRFIIDRCIADCPPNVTDSAPPGQSRGTPEAPLLSSLHSSKRLSDKERERNEEEARWARVTLDPAVRALETLEGSALKVLDVGLMTQLTKYIDGPLLPGAGIQVMAANLAAWRLEQTGDTSYYASSIGSVLQKWGGVLYRGLVPSGTGADVDDAAFDHICTKLASRFIPYITSHGILKLRRMNEGALAQLAIDLSVIKDALAKFPAEAYVAARPSAPYPAGYEAKLAGHKELIESKMSPAITLVKVLQITNSKAFVTTYGQLLEQRMQNPDAMQQCLALLDISKDVAVARVNMFRSLGGNTGGLVARAQPQSQLGGQMGDFSSALAPSGNMLSAANVRNWAATAQANMLNYKSSGVFSGMSSSLLSATDSKSFMAGTKELAAKSKDFMGKFRGKFGSSKGA